MAQAKDAGIQHFIPKPWEDWTTFEHYDTEMSI